MFDLTGHRALVTGAGRGAGAGIAAALARHQHRAEVRPDLTDADVDFVCSAVADVVGR